MKNKDTWKPSKYVYRKGRLRASRDPAEVGAGSRLVAELTADFYGVSLPRYAKGRLIDLGCGSVPLYEAYRTHITDAVCVDWPNSKHRNEHSDIEHDLTRPLPFRDGEFDTLIASDVLEHLPEPEKFWREMYRIAAHGGTVIMNVPFYYPLHEEPHDYYRYTEHALRRFAGGTGFRVLLLKPVGGSPEIMADLLAKHAQFIPLVGRPLALAVQFAARAFVRTRAGKRLSERTGARAPFGYFLIARKD